jgi:hypothetical protein
LFLIFFYIYRLYNPVITDTDTRTLCVTREVPQWVEKKARMLSSAPLRRCVISPTDQKIFPNNDIGTCGCDTSTGGAACDAPSVISIKYGQKEVCGGLGIPDSIALNPTDPSDIQYTDENGVFIYTDASTGTRYAECKLYSLGQAGFTLLVDGAVFDNPSLYVQNIPIFATALFTIPATDPDTWFTKDENALQCVLDASSEVYFVTADELSQMVETYQFRTPVLTSLEKVDGSETWEWNTGIATDVFYSIDTVGDFLGENVDCTTETGVCAAINFNNFAYNLLSGGANADLTDGMLSTFDAVGSAVEFAIPVTSPLFVKVYLWWTHGGGSNTYVDCVPTGNSLCTASDTSLSADYEVYECRCPSRVIQVDPSVSIDLYQVMIFDYFDETRTTSYPF